MIKAAIIGIGNIGFRFSNLKLPFVTTHYEAYMANGNTKLIAVADSDEKKLREFKRNRPIPAYRDYQAMLNECQPEIVSICTPDSTHYDIFRTVIDAPSIKGIWCEKPLTVDLAQARQMIALGRERNIKLLVNFIRRYDSFYQQVQQKRISLLGTIQTVQGYYSGGILTNGSHLLDLLLFLLDDCKEVRGISTPDGIIGQLSFNNIWASIHPLRSNHFSLFELDLLGTKARLTITNKPFAQSSYRYSMPKKFSYFPLPVMTQKTTKMFPLRKPHYMQTALHDLLTSITNHRQPLSSGDSAIQSLELIHALIYSAKHNGAPCPLPFAKKNTSLPVAQGELTHP